MRLNIQITGPAEDLIEELTSDVRLSKRDLVLDALSFYYAAASEVKEGGEVVSIRDGEKTKFVVPSLEALKLRLKKSAKLVRRSSDGLYKRTKNTGERESGNAKSSANHGEHAFR